MNRNSLEKYIEELTDADTVEEYEDIIQRLNESLRRETYPLEVIQKVKVREKYMVNRFSDESTKENMLKSKENLILYLNNILTKKADQLPVTLHERLEKYLDNFYLFLEALRETKPDKRASITEADLQRLQIENEYDLQHMLYAMLKPLYEDARREVAEDSGIGTVRGDIVIPSLHTIIEAKCTRKTMNLKKLTEEMEADIVHYKAEFIYFYVYDKEKVIKDKYNFETYFNKNFDGKIVKVIILQPVNM